MTVTSPAARRLVLADLLPGARVRDLVLVLAGAGLTGLAAQVSIHTSLSPVPFTLQTLAVLLVGSTLGALRGSISMAVYLLVGVAGLPWFAGQGSGWGGASFGYILGFIPAALVVGALAERQADRHVLKTVAMMVIGNVIVYAVGTTWLCADLSVNLATGLRLGVRPFLGSDLLKIVLAAVALPSAWHLVRRSGQDKPGPGTD